MSLLIEQRDTQPRVIGWLRKGKPLLGAAFLLTLFLLVTGRSLAQVCLPYPSPHQRFGFNVDADNGHTIDLYDVSSLKAHWYLDYSFHATPARPANMQFAQMIRTGMWHSAAFTQTVGAAITANPGALWIVGNEPDRAGQDGLTPSDYAMFYHDVYSFIKQRDSSSQVAVGAMVEGTPLRLHYLTIVYNEYQQRYGSPLPTDVWTVHGFILPECNDLGCWGASIPPGMDAFKSEGMQYTIVDHDDLTIFKQHIVAFRQWMADHGYRDKPLIVSEYGILLSPLHGFPYAKVRTFMLGTFDYFLNTMDSAIGYPADENRLVQSWSWFSLNSAAYNLNTGQGFNGNLFDRESKQLQPLGHDFAAYTANIAKEYMDLSLSGMQVNPITMALTTASTITVQINLANLGGVDAQQVAPQLWLTDAQGNRTLIVQHPPLANFGAGCSGLPLTFQWQPTNIAAGLYTLSVEVSASNANQETNPSDNVTKQSVLFIDQPFNASVYLPVIMR